MRAGKIVTAFALAAVVTASRGVSAHRLDECLQAARITIEPTHIELELDLTPGIAVADAIISEIDRDRDGSLSADEKQTYARRVLAALDLENDERPLDVKPAATTFAALDSLRRGEGMIRLRASAALPSRSTGSHHVFLRNRYRPDVSVYLANALVPESAQVAVTRQRHEAEQRELTIDYALRVEQSASMLAWILAIGAGIAALTALLIRSSTALPFVRSAVCSERSGAPGRW